MFSTPILYHTARKHVNGRIAKLSHQILCIFELIKNIYRLVFRENSREKNYNDNDLLFVMSSALSFSISSLT